MGNLTDDLSVPEGAARGPVVVHSLQADIPFPGNAIAVRRPEWLLAGAVRRFALLPVPDPGEGAGWRCANGPHGATESSRTPAHRDTADLQISRF